MVQAKLQLSLIPFVPRTDSTLLVASFSLCTSLPQKTQIARESGEDTILPPGDEDQGEDPECLAEEEGWGGLNLLIFLILFEKNKRSP